MEEPGLGQGLDSLGVHSSLLSSVAPLTLLPQSGVGGITIDNSGLWLYSDTVDSFLGLWQAPYPPQRTVWRLWDTALCWHLQTGKSPHMGSAELDPIMLGILIM